MDSVHFVDLGTIGYEAAFHLQEEALAEIAAGGEERVFLLEHPHVITMGRRAGIENLIARCGPNGTRLDVHRINRGGDITYHGPGQLVGYPHLDLDRRHRDLHGYLRKLEECLIRTAAAFDVEAYQRSGLTGVWTDAGKLASIGIGVRRWVTMHGFALNVATDLRYFGLINPCGIPGCPMTSLESLTGESIPMKLVKSEFIEVFITIFGSDAVGEAPNRKKPELKT